MVIKVSAVFFAMRNCTIITLLDDLNLKHFSNFLTKVVSPSYKRGFFKFYVRVIFIQQTGLLCFQRFHSAKFTNGVHVL